MRSFPFSIRWPKTRGTVTQICNKQSPAIGEELHRAPLSVEASNKFSLPMRPRMNYVGMLVRMHYRFIQTTSSGY